MVSVAARRTVDILYQFRKPILLSVIIILYLFSSVVNTQGEEPAQLVIGVAEWRHASGPAITVQSNTFYQLLDKLLILNQEEFEVILLPTSLETAREVDQIASKFGVDILVWGWYDEVAVRGYVDLANATEENGMTNSLAAYLENNGNPLAIRVLKILSEFDYYEDGVTFCVPRWTP
jgi:hypothetical protein